MHTKQLDDYQAKKPVFNRVINDLISKKADEIVNLLKKNYENLTLVNLNLNKLKTEFQENRRELNGQLSKAHYFNSVISDVLLDNEIITKVVCCRPALNLLIELADKIQGTFKSCATRYLDLLEKYSSKKAADQDQLFVDILEYAFFIGEKLAKRNYEYKEIEHEKILNLKNKLIDLFVENSSIAAGLRQASENLLIKYESAVDFFNNEILLSKYLAYKMQMIERLKDPGEKIDYIHDLLYPWDNNLKGLADIICLENFKNKKILFLFLENIYNKYCQKKSPDYLGYGAWVIFVTTDPNKDKEISRDGVLIESAKGRYENTIIYELKKKYNF